MADSQNDKQQKNRPQQNDVVDSARAFFASFGVLFLVFLIALVVSVLMPKEPEMAGGGDGAPVEINGETVYQQAGCMGCHGQNLEGGGGPALANIGSKYDEQQIADIIKNGLPPAMPGGLVSKADEIAALAKWLAEKK